MIQGKKIAAQKSPHSSDNSLCPIFFYHQKLDIYFLKAFFCKIKKLNIGRL
jgi:hypothetical protein